METKLDIKPMRDWGLNLTRPVVIAGPCSAESEEQMLETAIELRKDSRISIFRAGIWKPRTRPNSFEGVGSIGLKWMQTVKKETGFPVATEVANVKHAYEALKYGVDLIWIGARTTVNPFAVQEIADALQGTDIPILVKNPVNPDLELWIGAIERLLKAGITKVGAIHRGFSTYDKSKYRNAPYWQLAIDLKLRFPELALIGDPSHLGGRREILPEISQKMLDLNYDGLMIESHRDPSVALSDAKQQLTPSALSEMLTPLILRYSEVDNKEVQATLEVLREQIDRYDDQLLQLMEERMSVVAKIGEFKKANNLTILQSRRWDEIIKKNIEKGKEKGLSAEFIEKLLDSIHEESINHQNAVMNAK